MPQNDQYDEPRLLRLLSTGSEYAFTCVFDHHKDMVYSVALRVLKSPSIAEEVVQDVFLKIWTKRDALSGVISLDNYLFTMAKNNIHDRLRKEANERSARKIYGQHLDYVEDTDHRVRKKQYERLLTDAISSLPPQQQQVYKLAKIQGMSHQAIGEQMGIATPTVKKHMAIALQSIRHYLKDHLHLPFAALLISLLKP